MERFFKKTAWRGKCLEWQAARNDRGYGMFNRTGTSSKTILAHRFAYMLQHGLEILPRGSVIMHTCDNPCCVNHEHLRLGTHAENHDDKKNKGRSNIGTKHGHHKLTDEQVLEIRTLNMRQKNIASVYGITQ